MASQLQKKTTYSDYVVYKLLKIDGKVLGFLYFRWTTIDSVLFHEMPPFQK